MSANEKTFTVDVGIVKKQKNGVYFVEIAKSDKCNGCKACAFGKNEKIVLKANSEVECAVGDKVAIKICHNKNATLAYFTMFCIPLALIIIFALLAKLIWGNDLAVTIAMTVGLTLGFIGAYVVNALVEKRAKKLGEYPTIIKKI